MKSDLEEYIKYDCSFSFIFYWNFWNFLYADIHVNFACELFSIQV